VRYPHAQRVEADEYVAGYTVSDPYRWLEEAGDLRTRAWCQAQRALAARTLARLPDRASWRRALRPLLSAGGTTPPVWRGGRAFFTRQELGGEHKGLWVQEPDGRERILVQPARDTTLDGWYPSLAGDQVAVHLSTGGDEESVRWILDVNSAAPIEGPVTRCRKGAVAWLPDGRRYVHVRRMAPSAVPAGEERYHRRVWLHTVGTDPDEDLELPVEGAGALSQYQMDVSRDGRWLVVTHRLGTASRTDLWVAELAPDGTPHNWRGGGGIEGGISASIVDNTLYLLTDCQAPRRRLCTADLHDPRYLAWRDLLPQDPSAILTHAAVLDDGMVVAAHLVHARSRLTWHTSGGAHGGEVPLPGTGTVTAIEPGPPGSSTAYIGYTDFATPPTVLVWSADRAGATVTWSVTPHQAQRHAMRVHDRWYRSADGTPVHAYVLAPARAPARPRPTILTGYGGFGVSLTPAYSPQALAWVRAGGVYALANVRGGGEYGEEWHQAGIRAGKLRGLEDFEAVVDGLIADGWTGDRELAITGSSNGGLLVAAASVRRPHSYRAVACTAALLDMVRYERVGLGRLWRDEYGDAEQADELAWLLSYSPYHHVRPGTPYPAMLLASFEADVRVDPMHSRKMCAALQDATVGEAPIVLRQEPTGGHGDRAMSRWLRFLSDETAFLAHHLRLPPPAGSTHPTREEHMKPETIRDAVVKALVEVADVDPAVVTDDSALAEDLDIDSLSIAEIVVSLEDHLGIGILEADVSQFTTVGNVTRYLASLVGHQDTDMVTAEQ
jgi:prolyl oligopeptidase